VSSFGIQVYCSQSVITKAISAGLQVIDAKYQGIKAKECSWLPLH